MTAITLHLMADRDTCARAAPPSSTGAAAEPKLPGERRVMRPAGSLGQAAQLQFPKNAVHHSPMTKRLRLNSEADLRALLVSKGLRVTTARLAVLRELAALRLPTSHPEVAERMGSSHYDRVTVYRTLLSLADAGLLVRTQLGDGVWRYEMPRGAAVKHGDHPHFVCTDCGDVSCLPEAAVTLRGVAARGKVATVQLQGQCVDCTNQ